MRGYLVPWHRSERPRPRPRPKSLRPVFEVLEGRRLLASMPILVTKATDDGSPGTLRDAINQANAASGPAVIDFAIPGTGVQTILLTSDLPAITHPVTIDGRSQGGPGYQGPPLIALATGNAQGVAMSGLATTGLDFAAGSDGSAVQGLALHDFSVAAIVIAANAVTVAGNAIGTDPTGTMAEGNGDGVEITGARNLVGGSSTAARNIISGNTNDGILILGAGATGNVVQGNFIGTDASGSAPLGNLSGGVVIDNAPGNTIGGPGPGAGDVISGNGTQEGQGAGLLINGPGATGNVVQGNFIGTNGDGTVAVSNLGYGVALVGASGNTIGGTTSQQRNVISGNTFSGLLLSSAGTTGNVVQGNVIGLAADGVHPLGNAGDGITLGGGAADNLIGGTAGGAGNTIAGNAMNGIAISGADAHGNLVQGNIIGTNASSASALGNGQNGVLVSGLASNNTIGGTGAGAGNTIADNGLSGVSIESGTGDAILGNAIFANAQGGIILGKGANNDQSFPVLTAVVSGSTSSVVQGTIASTPDTLFRLEFFANDRADPSGFGQGQVFLPSATVMVTTGPDGTAAFSQTFPVPLAGGQFVTATATDPNGNTSEFSADAPVTAIAPTLAIAGTAQPEGTSGTTNLDFTVSLSAPSPLTTTVDYRTIDGTAVAGSDYLPTAGTLTLPPGVTTGTIPVPIIGHTTVGPAKTFSVVLSNPHNATIAIAQGTGTILNNNMAGQLQFSMPTFVASQDSGQATIVVTRTGGAASDVGVTFSTTTGGSAIPGVDYTPSSGTLLFGADQAIQTFTIPIQANLLLGGNKTVTLALSNPTGGGSLGPQSTAVLTIINANSLVVTNENDSGPGSLRQAILTANANPGTNTVTFAIPGAGPFVIPPLSTLPEITNPVVIDATTQPGYQATPIVTLDGSRAGPQTDGLDITAGGSTIRGLVIDHFSGSGILIQGNGGNTIDRDILGTDGAGDPGLGNGFDGVLIDQSPGNTIGGTGNVIADNGQVGVRITGAAASGNVVLGNLIGTDPSGTLARGNHYDGVFIDGAPNNTIGGGAPGQRNVISGNASIGVQINGSGATGNVVLGNLIGTDVNGTVALGNGLDGIFIEDAARNIIGGTAAAQRNIISGNQAVGVRISGNGSSGNVVEGNFIGTDATGTAALGNTYDGLFAIDAPNNLIGGTAAGAGNVISANGSVGIQLFGPGSSGNVVRGNFIGTDASGTAALGNRLDGIFINGAPNNTIGGPMAGARNLISANGSSGIQLLDPGASGNVVQGNTIGADVHGAARLGNVYGIFINNAPRNVLGGPGSAQNLVVGNTRANLFQDSGYGGPTVLDVTPTVDGGRITTVVIAFSNALDPARAQNLRNYRLKQLGRFAGTARLIPLTSAVYDPVARTVTLTLARPVSAGTRLRLTISGSARGGLTDTAGHLLDGDNNGRPGGTSTTIIGPPTASAHGNRRTSTSHPPTQHAAAIGSRRPSLGRLLHRHSPIRVHRTG